MTSKFVLLNCR